MRDWPPGPIVSRLKKLPGVLSITVPTCWPRTSDAARGRRLATRAGRRGEARRGGHDPGDVRLVEAKELFVTQGSLTDESFPVAKFECEKSPGTTAPIELTSIAFLGTSVESGSATAVVVATGGETFLGGMAESLSEQPTHTAFDRGIARFTWLMLRFILVMVPLVFVINGLHPVPVPVIVEVAFANYIGLGGVYEVTDNPDMNMGGAPAEPHVPRRGHRGRHKFDLDGDRATESPFPDDHLDRRADDQRQSAADSGIRGRRSADTHPDEHGRSRGV